MHDVNMHSGGKTCALGSDQFLAGLFDVFLVASHIHPIDKPALQKYDILPRLTSFAMPLRNTSILLAQGVDALHKERLLDPRGPKNHIFTGRVVFCETNKASRTKFA